MSYLVATPRKCFSLLKHRSTCRVDGTSRGRSWGAAALAAAVVSVSLLVGLLGGGGADPAFAQVGAECARAGCLVCDHVAGTSARTAGAEAWDQMHWHKILTTAVDPRRPEESPLAAPFAKLVPAAHAEPLLRQLYP